MREIVLQLTACVHPTEFCAPSDQFAGKPLPTQHHPLIYSRLTGPEVGHECFMFKSIC